MSDGDWYYQIHSYLEYTPISGEKITCMVEHFSLTEPVPQIWGSREICHNYGCFDSGDTQLSVTLDGDEVYYANYKKGELIWANVPQSMIYPRDEVMEEVANTLICFVNHFFPPSIKVKWTKNDIEVTAEEAFIKYLPNPDHTFHVFSTLRFIPREGDIYACTVEHEAQEEPQTRFWEFAISETSRGPAVFCGLGLSLGLLGVAAGVFLFVKGNHYN
ncbi:H-2 class II histocompatibility antigen, I-E alpha chain-like [Diretmus argenteus]